MDRLHPFFKTGRQSIAIRPVEEELPPGSTKFVDISFRSLIIIFGLK